MHDGSLEILRSTRSPSGRPCINLSVKALDADRDLQMTRMDNSPPPLQTSEYL